MSKLSVKLKITLIFMTLTVIIVSACSGIILHLQKEAIEKTVESRIDSSLTIMEERVTKRLNAMLKNNYISNGQKEAPKAKRYYEKGIHYLLYNQNGEIISPASPFDITLKKEFTDGAFRYEISDEEKYYIKDKKIVLSDGSEYWLKGIFPASNEEYIFEISKEFDIILTIILIILSGIGGYLMLARLLNPINKIVATANEISNNADLSKRININGRNDEIGHLADTFDIMLDKIERLMEKEKQFTSDVSHELRTPITVMLSECEFMKECDRSTPDFEDSLNTAQRQAKKMSSLVTELLTLSRMDKNKITVNKEKTDISELLNFICDEQEKIQNNNIKFLRNIKSGIYADVDRGLISRLFINIITNAFKYNKKDGSVTVTLTEDEKNIVFYTEDTGIGISDEDLPKIWERFYRADKSRNNFENTGSGLGLSMVKWIAEALDGEINVQSELGKGSIFTFKLKKER